jgi:hypothetical protein
MDITVTEASGLPSKAYLSIRLGETRRQAPYREGEPFRFPSANHENFKVDVFTQVGSSLVSMANFKDNGMAEETVTLDAGGHPIRLKLKMTPSDPKAKYKTKERTSRHQAAITAKAYLDSHAIQTCLQQMVSMVLTDKPEDPMEYMAKQLMAQSQGGKKFGSTGKSGYDSEISSPTKTDAGPAPAAAAPAAGRSPSPIFIDYASMPGLGDDPFPGFPIDACPDKMPDLSKHHSIMAEVLKGDESIYDKLKGKKTKMGTTFASVIKPAWITRVIR